MLPLQIEMFYCLTIDIIRDIYNPEVKSSFNHEAHVPLDHLLLFSLLERALHRPLEKYFTSMEKAFSTQKTHSSSEK